MRNQPILVLFALENLIVLMIEIMITMIVMKAKMIIIKNVIKGKGIPPGELGGGLYKAESIKPEAITKI